MLERINQTSSKQNENTRHNIESQKRCLAFNAVEDKGLIFKDWKAIKDSESKYKTVNKQTKSNHANKSCNKDRRKYTCFGVNHQGKIGFPPPKAFNYVNNFGIYGNSFGVNTNSCYNSFNNCGLGRQHNFLINNYTAPNKLKKSPHANHFTNDRSLPDNFTSDGVYYQLDLMQKPLPKPFKNNVKGKQLLHEFGTIKHNEKKNSNNALNNTKNILPSSVNKVSNTKTKTPLSEDPKIYVSNPNASKDGKAFIPKPKLPEDNLLISKEEKKKQWKEYREAMKPFKNREFYNAKRVVQRLGKKDIKDLNEKELFRLTNAREVMAAHKTRLSAKYSDYVKAEGKSNELGEVYVLKKPVSKVWESEKVKPKISNNFRGTYQNSIMEPGRKILGGYGSFKGFVPVDMIKVTTQ